MSLFNSVPLAPFWVFLQVFARLSALVAIAPVFGSKQVPTQVKIWLTLILAMILTPLEMSPILGHAGGAGGVPNNLYDFVATLVLQAAAGLLMGFAVSMVLAAFQIAGSLLDLQIGFTMAQTLNPSLGEMDGPLSQFQYFYALLLFLLANGHHILLVAVMRSFALLPASTLSLDGGGFLRLVSDITLGAFVNGLKVAAPACAVLLAVDVSFAFLTRAMPQMNIFFVGMPVKAFVGLALLVIVLPATAIFAGHLVVAEPQSIGDLFRAVRHT